MGSIVAIIQLIGAILFSIGSACFVWMAWADEWVLPLRLGCGLWIGGCVPYTFLALRGEVLREDTGAAFHVANALQIGGMLGWAIGSAFAFLDDLGWLARLPCVTTPFDPDESILDEAVGYLVAATGFVFQLKMGFDLIFPLNLLLLPLTLIEWFLRFQIVTGPGSPSSG